MLSGETPIISDLKNCSIFFLSLLLKRLKNKSKGANFFPKQTYPTTPLLVEINLDEL